MIKIKQEFGLDPEEAANLLPFWVVIAVIISSFVSIVSSIVSSPILGFLTLPFQLLINFFGFVIALVIAAGLYMKGVFGKIAYSLEGIIAFFGLLFNGFALLLVPSVVVVVGIIINLTTLFLMWNSREVYL